MQNKMKHTVKNIEKLVDSSFNKKYHLDNQLKEETLLLLEHKVARNKKEQLPDNMIVVCLSVV